MRLKRLFNSVSGGSWGVEPEEGEVTLPCVRGTDFDYQVLRVNTRRAPVRGFSSHEVAKRAARRGDLIIEKSGGGEQQPVGRAVLHDSDDIVMPTNFAARLSPSVDNEPRFLTYLLSALYTIGLTKSSIKQTTGIQNLDLHSFLDTVATGKGVPAALVMSTTCGMLQLAAGALDSPSPGEVLAQVNETLFARIPSNMFVTCFYAILDPNRRSLTYANAGHDLPYVRRSEGGCEELRARGMPLGLMPGMGYEEKEIILEAGEAALFYSDGLVEAHDPKGEMFGFPRLQALIAEHAEEGPLGEFLMEELYTFVGEGWEQEDDITLLTLKRSSSLS